jgi:hypothetical protein
LLRRRWSATCTRKHSVRHDGAVTIRNLTAAFLIALVLGAGVALRIRENVRDAAVVRQLNDQLQETRADVADATFQPLQLSHANKRLVFLGASKALVQVTAYALTDDFGHDPVFSNNTPARTAYAVPKHTLPAGRILNVALSPIVERKLHANLGDTIVLMSRNRTRQHLVRFADRLPPTETRPVVDILFANAHEARIWGRQSFYAFDISRPNSALQQR